MGIANLVPGLSGGTMLLSAGVYPEFIQSIAEISIFRFQKRSVIVLTAVTITAVIAILFLANPVKTLVLEKRFVMYSLFIGLTLGGVPTIWNLAKPFNWKLLLGAASGFTTMLILSLGQLVPADNSNPSLSLLFLAGVAGSSAMILPGVSGGYLLLLLGQYVIILNAVSNFKEGLLMTPINLDLVLESMNIGIPVGLGVLIGIIGVSNLLRWLLNSHKHTTLGALLGLLLGAFIGLWPFQQTVTPILGETVNGIKVTMSNIDLLKPEDWPVEVFSPSIEQIALCATLIFTGFLTTQAIGKISTRKNT